MSKRPHPSISLSAEAFAKLKAEAIRRGEPMSHIVTRMLERDLPPDPKR